MINNIESKLEVLRRISIDESNSTVFRQVACYVYEIMQHLNQNTNIISEKDYSLPSIKTLKGIIINVLEEKKTVKNSTKLREFVLERGYQVNKNTLQYVLQQNKQSFVFNKKSEGWRLRDAK